MARYTLNQNHRNILTSWLFEQDGYLDGTRRLSDGMTARQALAANPGLDVTQWIRLNPTVDPATDTETAMVWWMRANEGVNITPPTRPPETTAWVAIIQAWDQSIVNAFGRVSQQSRDGNSVTITAENGSTSTMPAGQQLLQQRSLFAAVLSVLV